MPTQAAFMRLVLGDPGAADPPEPGTDRVDAVAGAWRACLPELARRRASLSWSEPAIAGTVEQRLAGLPDLERGAVVAQAFALDPGEIEQAIGAEPGAAPGLLARAHAALVGARRPADRACAEERERVAVGGRAGRSPHCEDCAAFAELASAQRRELRRAAKQAERDAGGEQREAEGAQREAARTAAGMSPAAAALDRVVEPRGLLARLAVGLVVLVACAAAGFGLVRAWEAPGRGDSIGDDGVVTATPVGPLPPGVGPTVP